MKPFLISIIVLLSLILWRSVELYQRFNNSPESIERTIAPKAYYFIWFVALVLTAFVLIITFLDI